jgi:3-(3-hydroxy-phenyl)propionate hydroxylase
VETGPERVVVTTEAGVTWTADYVVGADGARSAVRAGIGAALEGPRSATWFVIADVANPPEGPALPVERHFHYEHPAVGGRNVLIVPFPGGWRVDLQCREGDDPDAYTNPEGLRDWVGKVLHPAHAEHPTWVSTYRFLQAVADAFTDPHRRALLVGEAAHLFAPFGARGMNSGIGDADAAAEAVRRALDAPDEDRARGAIERCARERRDVALVNRAAAGQALGHMQASDPRLRARRRLALELAARTTRVGAWLDEAPYGPRYARQGPRQAGSPEGRHL